MVEVNIATGILENYFIECTKINIWANNSASMEYSAELWTCIHLKKCTTLFIEALFMLAQNMEQYKCPVRVDE